MKKTIFILFNIFCILFIIVMFFNSIFGQEELIGEKAPLFTLSSINDENISLESFRGKIVLLDFFATWCGPCRIEMQYLKNIYKEYKEKNFIIISIDLYENSEKVKEFINENNIEWIVVIDKDGQVSSKYHIQFIPTLILIDPNGIIVEVYIGVTSINVLKEKIEALMSTTIKTTATTTTHYITTVKNETLTLTTYKTDTSTIIEHTTIAQTYTILEGISIQWIILLLITIAFIIMVTLFIKKKKYK